MDDDAARHDDSGSGDGSDTTTSECSGDSLLAVGQPNRMIKRIKRGKVLTQLFPGDIITYYNQLYVNGSTNSEETARIKSIKGRVVTLHNGFHLEPDMLVRCTPTKCIPKRLKYNNIPLKDLILNEGIDEVKAGHDHDPLRATIKKAMKQVAAISEEKIGEIFGELGDNKSVPKPHACPQRRSKRITKKPRRLIASNDKSSNTNVGQKRKHGYQSLTQLGDDATTSSPSKRKTA